MALANMGLSMVLACLLPMARANLGLSMALACLLPMARAQEQVIGWRMPSLTYEEQVAAFAAQGIANQAGPRVFFDSGAADFDWAGADKYWADLLTAEQRATITWADSTCLCGLVRALPAGAIAGALVYGDAATAEAAEYGDGWTYALALTLAGLERVLPVSESMLAAHACLGALPVAYDWRESPVARTREDAYAWAVAHLLPRTSNDTIFNLNKYRVPDDPDAFRRDTQSNATVTNADYAVQRRAFTVDLETHMASQAAAPVTDPTQLPNWDDATLFDIMASHYAPLFGAFGWSRDETSWTNVTSKAGGTVFCSFASPNLSFWSLFPLPGGRKRARPLPRNDRGLALDRGKTYVTFMTNEGDTPRIIDSVFSASWASPRRGTLPVAWSVDAALAERFPALFDHFAATASANDSFVAGVSGAGYVYVDQLSEAQLDAYGRRYGRLAAAYGGPSVVDTYGQASPALMAAYARAAAAGGAAPDAFVSQPTTNMGFPGYFNCSDGAENRWLDDGTPVVCSHEGLFYYAASFWHKDLQLNASHPAADLAGRIRAEAARVPTTPAFVLAYGGLRWTSAADVPSMDFYTLQQDALDLLGDDFVVVGAQEMARLARSAQA